MTNYRNVALIGLCLGVCLGSAAPAKADALRYCWVDAKSNAAVPIFPRESVSDPADPNHRSRPEMRGEDGTVYPGADFIQAPDGWWIDAVTGRSADGFPENSSPDPANPERRVLYKEDSADDVIVADFKRVSCADSKASQAMASPAVDIGRLTEEVLAEINAARTNPAAYAERFRSSNNPAVLEAVDFLKRQKPLPPLKAQVALATSASRHAVDQGSAGLRSHVGTDGSSIRDRVAATGFAPSEVGEEIAFDADTGMGVARQLIVDDGVADRGHRVSLFDASLTYAGVACGAHKQYRTICVIDVSGPVTR